MPDFNEVAENIIKGSINTAIFIDDKALENFKSRNSNNKVDNKRTIELFNDFKKNHCLLHSFRFTKNGWQKDKKFYLKNKDLLILDWQLVGDDHTEALKIIDDAILEKSLHFICIYTQASKDSVKNELNRFFSGKITNEQKSETRKLLEDTDLDDYWSFENTDAEWIEFETMINSIANAKYEDREVEIQNFLLEYNLEGDIFTHIKSLYPNDIVFSFQKFRSILSKENEHFSRFSEEIFIKSQSIDYTCSVGHTIIKIFEKDTISGQFLYESFLKSLLSEKNIFLTLMGLEMRNRFRENSAFIGMDFGNLSENAFFYHKSKNLEHPHVFLDFLRDILVDHVTSFMNLKDLSLFEVLDDYYEKIDGGKRLADFQNPINANSFQRELFGLNYFYNRIDINQRAKNDSLRFGDVLSAKVKIKNKAEEIEEIDKYFICITPHCDCLRPTEKIKNQFWFVEGKKEDPQVSVLKKTDGKFISFIKSNNEIIALNWTNGKDFCQPITIHISNNKISIPLIGDYFSQKIELKLLTTIKENYTQRIANESFGYPLRVGIDYVKK